MRYVAPTLLIAVAAAAGGYGLAAGRFPTDLADLRKACPAEVNVFATFNPKSAEESARILDCHIVRVRP